jgi:hypothetical protein
MIGNDPLTTADPVPIQVGNILTFKKIDSQLQICAKIIDIRLPPPPQGE